MNETDFLRQQLTLERTHLQEILQAVRQAQHAPAGSARDVHDYIQWAGQRLVRQLALHCEAMGAASAGDVVLQTHVRGVANAAALCAADHGASWDLRAQNLLALLGAWTGSLEAQAGRALRIAHWRQAAQLSADTILQERQRYAAARAALGLP